MKRRPLIHNLSKLSPQAVLELWNKGTVSLVEAVSYLLFLWATHDEVRQAQAEQLAQQTQQLMALNITLYQLQSEVDSLKVRVS